MCPWRGGDLDQHGVDINSQDGSGWSGLIWATWRGHTNIAMFLLSLPGIDITMVDNIGQNVLHVAAKREVEVVPFSHCDESKIIFRARYPTMAGIGDWCPLSAGDPMYKDAMLLLAEPGDLILWDSRTVHGGRVGTGVKITYGDGRDDKFVNGDFKNTTGDTASATIAADETTANTTEPCATLYIIRTGNYTTSNGELDKLGWIYIEYTTTQKSTDK